jgi:hypothetical protein
MERLVHMEETRIANNFRDAGQDRRALLKSNLVGMVFDNDWFKFPRGNV